MPLPPIAARHPVTTTRHGEVCLDDYAWLRERENPEVVRSLEAENAYAESVLAPTAPLRDVLYHEMVGRIRETDLSVPVRRGAYWYFTRTEEGKQYPIHCRRRGLKEGEGEEVLLDLNRLAEGRSFMALGDFAVSEDGTRLAYSLDETGYRQYRLRVKDLTTGAHLAIERERVTSVAWDATGDSLLYTVEDGTTKRSFQLWQHRLGEAEDRLVHEELDEAFSVSVVKSRSREWLMLQSGSHTTSEWRLTPAASPDGPWRVLIPRRPEIEYDVVHHGAHFYLRINDAGRNFRLARSPVGAEPPVLEEVLPHRPAVMLEGVDAFAGHLVLSEREAGLPHLRVRRLADGTEHRVDFPEPAYEAWLHSNPEWNLGAVQIGYQSLVTPTTVWEYDLESRQRTVLKQQEVLGGYDPARYRSERFTVAAGDGTPIPVSLVCRADLPRGAEGPGLLTGYGAYGYPYPIAFSSARLSLLDRGVTFAIAHVRGGGELGKGWHDAGRMARKMNTFTDFMAVGESLQATGRVVPGRLAIEGGSAGGLLMGAVTNLRPELWGAVISHVPFVDVLNTMSDAALPLTVGEYEEWGNPDVEEQYRWMRSYCPYTNLTSAEFPPMLVRTSLNDSQVMYWEPAKYVAKARLLKRGAGRLLLLTNLGAGHGGASGRYDHLREVATDYAFLLSVLGVESVAPAWGHPEVNPESAG